MGRGLARGWQGGGKVGVATDGAPTAPTLTPRLLATCSADQTCKIWRTSNFSLMTELSIKSSNPGESSRGWMWGCAFSGDSQYIVTGKPVRHALLSQSLPGPCALAPALPPERCPCPPHSLLGQPGSALVCGDRRDQERVRGPPESCGLLGLQ